MHLNLKKFYQENVYWLFPIQMEIAFTFDLVEKPRQVMKYNTFFVLDEAAWLLQNMFERLS